MKNIFRDKETLWHNLGNTFSRRLNETEEKSIALNFDAKAEELAEIAGLAVITGMLLNTFELPDTEEYDVFTDFLWFCNKIREVLPEEETDNAPITVMATEHEIEAINYLLSHSMSIFSRNENLSNRNADQAILIESFRRRIMKAAGK